MYAKDLLKIKRSVRKFSGTKAGWKVYVFGVSEPTHHIIAELRQKKIPVCGVLDNDVRKQQMYCGGVAVIGVEEFLKKCGELRQVYIFILSPFWREMKRQLVLCGIKKQHVKVIRLVHPVEEWFWFRVMRIRQGKQIYQSIIKKYGKDHRILLCPYTGTGDIYLIGTFLQQYLSMNRIERYVLIVVSKACEKVAGLFPIQNIERLSNTDACSSLIFYYMVEPDECHMDILNDCWGEIYTNPVQWIRGYKGHHFMEMFRRYVFHLPENAKPCHPKLRDRKEEVEAVFHQYGLVPFKTVILSPYATTLSDMPVTFWERLADSLKKKGYVVCTNSSGEKEPAVPGTRAVFFSLDIAPQVVEQAGTFIGIRSGFCDVISHARAKKIILYDRNNWFYNCSAFEYFSLKKMELCEDAIEIEFEQDTFEELREHILQYVEGDLKNGKKSYTSD